MGNSRTWDFSPVGAGTTTTEICILGDGDVSRECDPYPDDEESIAGCVATKGLTTPPKCCMVFTDWIINGEQRKVILEGFIKTEKGRRRLSDPDNIDYFYMWDEIDKIADCFPPERAYVPGSVEECDSVGNGEKTTLHYPKFKVKFTGPPEITCYKKSTDEWLLNATVCESEFYTSCDELPAIPISVTVGSIDDTLDTNGTCPVTGVAS